MPPIFFYLVLPLLVVGIIFFSGFALGIYVGRNNSETRTIREPDLPRIKPR